MSASRLDGLYAMAQQDASPHERDIARAKLEAMGAWPPPPRPPARPAAPSPAPQPFGFAYPATTGTTTSGWSGTVFIRVSVT